VYASEGAHSSFAPRGDLQRQIQAYIEEKFGYCEGAFSELTPVSTETESPFAKHALPDWPTSSNIWVCTAFIHSFIRSFVHSFILSFTHPLIHSSIHLFICSFTMCLLLGSGAGDTQRVFASSAVTASAPFSILCVATFDAGAETAACYSSLSRLTLTICPWLIVSARDHI